MAAHPCRAACAIFATFPSSRMSCCGAATPRSASENFSAATCSAFFGRSPKNTRDMPKRIAIVEDEADLAGLIGYNLTRDGYEAQVLAGSEGTLESLEQYRPDLILLDIMLPEMDGFELCRQIRGSAALARTPVLFLTARSDEVDRVLGLEIGGGADRANAVRRRGAHAPAEAP